MSDYDQMMMQQRLFVIYYYMRVLGIGFLEALWMEANPFPMDDYKPRHAACRSVIRIENE